jgi:hypothetical protein
VQRWLASANALIKSSGSFPEALQLAVACENLDGPLRARNAETIINILHHVLAEAELNAPRSVMLIGGDLDAYEAMRQLLSTAADDALLVQPDAAGKILADYAVLARERVRVRLFEARARKKLARARTRWSRGSVNSASDHSNTLRGENERLARQRFVLFFDQVMVALSNLLALNLLSMESASKVIAPSPAVRERSDVREANLHDASPGLQDIVPKH